MHEKGSVLVVEGDKSLSFLLALLIEREEFRAELLPHGSSALQIVERLHCRSYDAIVIQLSPFASPIDRRQPAGIPLLNLIAQLSPRCLSKTIVLTAFHTELSADFEKRCRFLWEPFTTEDLTSALRSCVEAEHEGDLSPDGARSYSS